MDTEIRDATIADVTGLAALWGEADAYHHVALPDVFAPPIEPARSSDFVAAILGDPDQGLLVAEAGDRLVGLIQVMLRERRPPMVPRRFAVVDAVAVAAGYRGAGIGRRLMAAAEDWARERGASEVWLDVWEFNVEAIGFYEALGYETVSRRIRRDVTG